MKTFLHRLLLSVRRRDGVTASVHNAEQHSDFMRRKKTRAFTLVEILVSAGIMVAVVAILADVFGHATRAWVSGNKLMSNSQAARTALELMNRDLRSLYVYIPPPGGSGTLAMIYGQSTLNFYATVPNPSGAWDVCRIHYWVAPNAAGTAGTLNRDMTYVTAVGSSASLTVSNALMPVGLPNGFSITSLLSNSVAITAAAPTGTTTIPARVFIHLQVIDPSTIRATSGTVSRGSITYDTSIAPFQGFR